MYLKLSIVSTNLGNKANAFITTKLLDFVHHPDFHKPEIVSETGSVSVLRRGGGGAPTLQKKQKACLSTGDARTKEGQPLETRGL
jgi:hypothetical protein